MAKWPNLAAHGVYIFNSPDLDESPPTFFVEDLFSPTEVDLKKEDVD